jgi:hypothetical protein
VSIPIEWPDTLPCPAALPTRSYERRSLQSRPYLARPFQRDRHQFQEVTFVPMNYATATALRTFWREDLEFGGNWFSAPTWSRPQGAGGVRRFIGPLEFSYIPGTAMGYWRATGTVEIRGVGEVPVRPDASAIWLLNEFVTSGGLGDEQPWILSNGDRTVFVPDEAGSLTGVEDHYQGGVFSNMPQAAGKRYFEIEAGRVFPPVVFAPLFDTSLSWGLVSVNEFTVNGAETALGTSGSWAFLPMLALAEVHYSGDDGAGSVTNIDNVGALADGTVFGFAVDIDGGNLWVSVDGTWVTGDPGTETSPIATNMTSPPYNIAFAAQRAWAEATLRTIPSELTYPVPSGFTYWADLDA